MSKKIPTTTWRTRLTSTSTGMSGGTATAAYSGVMQNGGTCEVRKLPTCAITPSALASDNSANDQCLSRRHHKKKAMENTSGTTDHSNAEIAVSRMLIMLLIMCWEG